MNYTMKKVFDIHSMGEATKEVFDWAVECYDGPANQTYILWEIGMHVEEALDTNDPGYWQADYIDSWLLENDCVNGETVLILYNW